MQRFRHYDGFTGKSEQEKLMHAQQLQEIYSTRLRSGWNPFTDDAEVIYTDHLDYKSVADLYGTRRTGNNSIRVWISKFLESLEPTVSLATYQTYQSKFRIFFLWLEKQKVINNDLSTFDNNLILDFFSYLINIRKLSGISIQKYTQNLTALFEYCKEKKIININPVYDIPRCNRINDQAPRPIHRADIEIFKVELVKDPELWLAVQFEFYCCMRPGHEIIEMQIKHIDFIAGTVLVTRRRAKVRIERLVTIPRQFLDHLRKLGLQKLNKEWYVFGSGGVPGPKHIGKNKLRYKFAAIRKKLNMPYEYKFYSWKHTGLVEADEAGMPFKDTSRHAGHTSLKSTDFYFRNKRTGVSNAIKNNYPDL
jgi:integrase